MNSTVRLTGKRQKDEVFGWLKQLGGEREKQKDRER